MDKLPQQEKGIDYTRRKVKHIQPTIRLWFGIDQVQGDDQDQTSVSWQESTAAAVAFLTRSPQLNCDSLTTSPSASRLVPALPTWYVDSPMCSVPA